MSALAPSDVERFGKILGLLGSNHDGERAAAAAKATGFLKARELAWQDVADMLKRPPAVMPAPQPAPAHRSHQMDARRCLSSGVTWRMHEREFLLQMADQLRRPTDKQRD